MKRRVQVWIVLCFFFVGSFLLALSVGPVHLSFWDMSAVDKMILWHLRFPRTLSAFLVGGGLALSGAIFQGLFRNPLADSYLLGVSSGASLGAAAALVLGLSSPFANFTGVTAFSFAGSLLALAAVFYFGSRKGQISVFRLLLAGLGVGLFLSSVVAVLMLVAEEQLKALIFFFLGGFSTAGWDTAWIALACVPVGVLTSWFFARELNVLLLGDETAKSSGISIVRIQLLYAVLAAFLTAVSVSVAGLIGFVGLIIPHMIRITLGTDHQTLFPLTFVGGGIFLVICDTVAKTVIAPAELPVGIVTSIVGVPVFLYLLRKVTAEYGL